MKSKLKVKNGGRGVLMCFLLIKGSVVSLRANPEELIADIADAAVDYRDWQVEWAKKILNGVLFEAIKQGSLKGVTFLIGRGADPTVENRCGRISLEFAEHLAEKNPEESERQAIVNFLRHWDSEQYAVDDATIINAARKISGLNGGGKAGLAKKAIRSFCKSHPKTAAVAESAAVGAVTGAAVQGIQEGVSCYKGEKKDGSLGRIAGQAVAGACEGVAGDAARHGVQKVAGKVLGIVAEGTAIEAARCAIDNSGGIIQDLWGIGGGIAGAALGEMIGRPLTGGILGEMAGERFGKTLENVGEWAGEKVSDILFSEKMEETSKPAVRQEVQQIKRSDSSPTQKKSSISEERYYCESCRRYF